jgi:hypothetical protein
MPVRPAAMAELDHSVVDKILAQYWFAPSKGLLPGCGDGCSLPALSSGQTLKQD